MMKRIVIVALSALLASIAKPLDLRPDDGASVLLWGRPEPAQRQNPACSLTNELSIGLEYSIPFVWKCSSGSCETDSENSEFRYFTAASDPWLSAWYDSRNVMRLFGDSIDDYPVSMWLSIWAVGMLEPDNFNQYR
jgi:hypothetical protein